MPKKTVFLYFFLQFKALKAVLFFEKMKKNGKIGDTLVRILLLAGVISFVISCFGKNKNK